MANYSDEAIRLKREGASTDAGSYRTGKPKVYSGLGEASTLSTETAPQNAGHLVAGHESNNARNSHPDIVTLDVADIPAEVLAAHQGQGISTGTDLCLNSAVGAEVDLCPSLVESREK